MKLPIISVLLLISTQSVAQVIWSKGYQFENTGSVRLSDMEIDTATIYLGGFYLDGAGLSDRYTYLLRTSLSSEQEFNLISCESGVPCNLKEDILQMAVTDGGKLFASGNRTLSTINYFGKLKDLESLKLSWKTGNVLSDSIHHIDQIETVSDGVLISGSFSDVNRFVNKYDFDGTKIWSARLPVSYFGPPSHLLELSSGSFAHIYFVLSGSTASYLSIVDSSGFVEYNEPMHAKLLLCVAANNTNEILAVQRISIQAPDVFLAKYTTTGQRILIDHEFDLSFAKKILVNDNDDMFFIRETIFEERNALEIVKLSSSGAFLYNDFIYDTDMNHFYSDAELIQDDLLIFTGKRNILSTGESETYFTAFKDRQDSTTSTHQNSSNLFEIRPNPAGNEIGIFSRDHGLPNSFLFSIFSLNGQRLIKGEMNEFESINVGSLKSGTYLIKVYDSEHTFVGMKKFVKI